MSGLANSILIFNQMVALEAAIKAIGGGGGTPAADGSPLPPGTLMDVPEGSVPPAGWTLAQGGSVLRQAFPKYAEVTPFSTAITSVTKHVIAGVTANQEIYSVGNGFAYTPADGDLGGLLTWTGAAWTKGTAFVPAGHRIMAMRDNNAVITVDSSTGLYHFWCLSGAWSEVFTGLNLRGDYYKHCVTCIDGYGFLFRDKNTGILWEWFGWSNTSPSVNGDNLPAWTTSYSNFNSPFSGYQENNYAPAIKKGSNSVSFGNLRVGSGFTLEEHANISILDRQGDPIGNWMLGLDAIMPAKKANGDDSFIGLCNDTILLPTDATNQVFQEHRNRSGAVLDGTRGGINNAFVNFFAPYTDYYALRVVAGSVGSDSALLMSWTPETWFLVTHPDLPPSGSFGGFLQKHPSFYPDTNHPLVPPQLFIPWRNGATQYVVEIALNEDGVISAPVPTIAAGTGMKKALYLGPETKIPIVYVYQPPI